MIDQEREALELAKEALDDHVANWLTVTPILEAHVYPDAPQWNAWTRWGERACHHAEDARHAVKAALAAREEPRNDNAETMRLVRANPAAREDTERPDEQSARQRFDEATDAFTEVFYRNEPQDAIRPLVAALKAFSNVMGIALPETERPAKAKRSWAQMEQEVQNDQARRMESTGRCPCCGADV